MTESAGVVIEVEPRQARGSAEAGRLRRRGRVPAVVYGGGKETVAVSVEREALDRLLRHGRQRIFRLRLSPSEETGEAMVKDLQVDPISGHPLHVDLIRVEKGHKIQLTVPVALLGDCRGVREGGRLDFTSRQLAVEVLPKDIIFELEVDISDLGAGTHLTVADLAALLPPSGRFLEEPSRVVVLVEKPRGAEDEEEPVAEPAGPAEPELIRTRGKEAEEE